MSTLNLTSSAQDFKCDYGSCSRHYRTRFGLRRHYLTHLGIKQHECPYCEKRFALSQYLTEHINIHTGNKPFVCTYPGCNKKFRQAGKLSIHKKQHSLVDFSDSSSESSTELRDSCCTFSTIEAVFTQIAAFPLPSFFYTRILPVPKAIAQAGMSMVGTCAFQEKSSVKTKIQLT